MVGQALEGVPWGFFIANSPAYASEIVPLPLRGACTATLQMSWSIGQIIVSGATYGYNKRDDEWAWRIPLALQWIFPVCPNFSYHREHAIFLDPNSIIDSLVDSHLPRPRIPLVAYSPWAQGRSPSFHQASWQ